MITKEQVAKAEAQIYQLRKSVRYDIRELTIEIMVNKYEKGIEYNEDDEEQDKKLFYNVLFIPDYQRDFTWDDVRQSRFIESVLLGLPIPLVFVAENKYSAWEIVDGSQRIRTLEAFKNNKLCLRGLDKIDTLNGFFFKDLEPSRQGKFIDTPLRMIVLSEDADDEVKRDMFERINRGSDLLKPMEKRKGIYLGAFKDFIYDLCAKPDKVRLEFKKANELLHELAPIDLFLENRQEREELVLRYFALLDNDNYLKFPQGTGVERFLNDFLEKKNSEWEKIKKNPKDFEKELNKYYSTFENMLIFVKKYSQYGFRRAHNPQTKRVIFEAVSTGVSVALQKNPKLSLSRQKITEIINSEEFKFHWNGITKVHEPSKVKARVEFIVNKLIQNNA